jgi:ATP-dependent DNA helicase PIF1
MELEKLKYQLMTSQLKSDINLSTKQNLAFKLMTKGENVFITGVAGSGKTSCIKLFIKIYKSDKKIGFTSTTGISALLFGGVTLHSFLGIGLGTESVDDLTSKICKRSYLRKRF